MTYRTKIKIWNFFGQSAIFFFLLALFIFVAK